VTPGVWAEFLTDTDVSVALAELADSGTRLHLALEVERIGDSAFASLTRRASDAGVPVFVWPLLPKELGYWIGEVNVDHAARALDRIVAWRADDGGPSIQGVSVDLEPAWEYSEELRALGGRPDRLLACLARHVHPSRHAAAREILTRAVDRTKRVGLRMHAVTYPLLLDAPAGDPTLEDALDIVVQDIAWDEISFMVYQTAFQQLAGAWFGPRLVFEYGRAAVERFGERAGLDLGVVGEAGVGLDPGGRYSDPEALAADVRAGLAAGIPLSRMRVYGLDGIVAEGGPQRWLTITDPSPREPSATPLVTGLRHGVSGIATALRVTRRE
jgi:hypothetical protein